jgi:hypothetical protein
LRNLLSLIGCHGQTILSIIHNEVMNMICKWYYILIFSVKASIERYKKACSDSSGAKSASESNTQVFIICSQQLYTYNKYLA